MDDHAVAYNVDLDDPEVRAAIALGCAMSTAEYHKGQIVAVPCATITAYHEISCAVAAMADDIEPASRLRPILSH